MCVAERASMHACVIFCDLMVIENGATQNVQHVGTAWPLRLGGPASVHTSHIHARVSGLSVCTLIFGHKNTSLVVVVAVNVLQLVVVNA